MAEYERVSTSLEEIKKCPYCGEEHFARSLYGHVAFSADDDHGPRGSVPDGFRVSETETVGVKPISKRVRGRSDEVYRCKHCGGDFKGKAGLETHLGMLKGDSQHPESATADTAGIWVPQKVADPEPDTEDAAAAFQAHMGSLSDHGEKGAAEGVPVAVLEDLLDEYRQREQQGAGFVTAARMLDELLEEYRDGQIRLTPL
ncbi:hypothetical protein [Halobellus limi]|uniref:C2H2-type domain-containing protein n=1 Tax=Halobellus limi TaxID=699433 RepID=A0A1H5ZHC8_9EURY|nr:hypothetical protein [Halobellus limi]QCC48119.1 hypothetical protein DV707_10845 [Halobellus limi]SEG34806.1 hypothetical protein SAMN04488133_1968 [Halobellus limi]